MERVIEVGVDKFSYKESVELKDIEFSAAKGEFIVITGKSGCGKTTLLRIMNGLIPNFFEGSLEGKAKLFGKDILSYEKGELARHIGNVFQNPSDQFFSCIAEDEIALTGENLGMHREMLYERVNFALKELGIEKLRNRSVFEMSGGEKQKVAIASTLVFDTDIILFDEPSASLDREATEELRKTLTLLKEKGKTIIIAEHRLYYLKELIDRLVVMENKTIACEYKGFELNEAVRKKHNLRTFDYLDEVDRVEQTNPNGEPDIKIESVDIQRKKKIFSQDISFIVSKGECLGIVGDNGRGKTTLAKQLAGLLPIKKGITSYGRNKRERIKNFYYLMQDPSVQLFSSTVEHELIPKSRMNDKIYLDKVKYYLKEVDLFDKRGRSPHELSVGEKQRLSVVVSFLAGRKCIILDEPTAGLDFFHMEMVSNLIEEEKKEVPIILITHDLELLGRVCDRVIRL